MASVEFLLNGVLKRCDVAPDTSALNLLRDTLGYTGTKEGCASGDCGACTVALRDASAPDAAFTSVNACITPAHQLQNKLLVTVEGLETPEGLHPAQETMIECHASQCGFCTPGIVMSLFTLYQGNAFKAPFSHQVLEEALGGNLCRCTGYRPIRDAALQMQTMRWQPPVWLSAINPIEHSTPPSECEEEASFFKSPASLEALLDLRAHHKSARLVAGATDLWLESTQQLRSLDQLIDVTRVDELRRIEAAEYQSIPGWWIGAAVTYTELETLFERHFPAFAHLLSRLGSRQIRNRGTLGGNVANASPIGDTPPVLLALGAWLEIVGPNGARRLPLESFFVDYKKTDLQSDEVISRIFIPSLTEHAALRVWKLSKRREDDISAVLGAFHYVIDGGFLSQVRLGFGGMDAVPKRALHAEAALEGQPVTQAGFQAAQRALTEDFAPMSDVRGSSHYRQQAASNLLERLYLTLTAPTQEVMIHAYAH
ncbi:xanthine dehydrogenase small subunit [Halomonas sp. HMF6819]|uniref:xanthine dehydrogenase small subunit n=1 Tax=Halomonas sp. HMF6819 TaxID=3373085 RepID=UPI0037AEAD5F